MRLTELLKTDQVTISCELFHPKQVWAQLANYKNIVADMAALKPAYMSVTYGATGGTSDYTVELASEVEKHQIPALAHLTCASSTKEKVASVIEELKEKQISNILALRGDIPQNADFPLPNQYRHASELIADIKAQGDFCIGGACYPEGHPEADTIFEDLDHLKEKVDAGCEFLTTQMFFDNHILYNFLYKALPRGIDVPVVAGIMPAHLTRRRSRGLSVQAGCSAGTRGRLSFPYYKCPRGCRFPEGYSGTCRFPAIWFRRVSWRSWIVSGIIRRRCARPELLTRRIRLSI